MKIPLPIHPKDIIRYTMGKPLDFAPGTAYAYSNFGYCVLGRVIEAVAQKPYHEFVSEKILAPLGIRDMRQGKNLLKDRAPGEVKYYDGRHRTGRAISGPGIGEQAPLPYGVECIETMDANGGWIASAVDLVRFAAALDDPQKCPILKEESILTMLEPPPGPVGHGPKGKPKAVYYGCGWDVRPARKKASSPSFTAARWPEAPRSWFAAPTTSIGPCCSTPMPTKTAGVGRLDRSASAQAGGRNQGLAQDGLVLEVLMRFHFEKGFRIAKAADKFYYKNQIAK